MTPHHTPKRFVTDNAPEHASHWIGRGEQLGDALTAGVALFSALLALVLIRTPSRGNGRKAA